MINFYIYYNTHTHIYNSGKPETVHRYWPVPKYIISLVKPVQPPVRDGLPYFKHVFSQNFLNHSFSIILNTNT